MSQAMTKSEYNKEQWATNPEYREKSRHRRWLWRQDKKTTHIDRPVGQKSYKGHQYYETLQKWTLKSKYGLTPLTYNALYESQGCVCAICKQDLGGFALANIDHCHATNKVRGILCKLCNLGLGYFKDNPKSLNSAISYLQASNVTN